MTPTDPATQSTERPPRSTEATSLPRARPGRVEIEPVSPVVDGGRFAAKATTGEIVTVTADLFADGHVRIAGALRHRPGGGTWTEIPLVAGVNDRWTASFVPDEIGPWEYTIHGWVDHFETWRQGTTKKVAAGQDVAVELEIGLGLVDALAARARGADRAALAVARETLAAERIPRFLEDAGAAADAAALAWRCAPRQPTSRLAKPLRLTVDRERARFSAWYEFFPRSTVDGTSSHGTLADAIGRLDHIADLGFDVVYVPPIHPIGITKRKGPNNTTTCEPGDVGVPWAIGSTDGGHTAVHPDLGTVDDVVALAAACRERDMDLALDMAFQCSPDHPWVSEHPEWFEKRPDGTVQFAENPPKRYEDIYPLHFENDDWQSLWCALRDVMLFWVERGVKVFRVDNPHTKPFAFWEWAIAQVRAEHPDVVFLAEAFTRPRVMERLAKLGFTQSYTYFAWRTGRGELEEYLRDLSSRTVDYFRPNFWPNTPDILTEQLQTGGRAAFRSRAVLAATLTANWGVYGPAFELCEHEPLRPGSEEYLNSEKYQLRSWDLDRPDSLAPLLARLNEIRRTQPALQHDRTIRFHRAADERVICWSKTDPAGEGAPVLVVVNLDPHQQAATTVDVDWGALGLAYDATYQLTDLLGGGEHTWVGAVNYVELAPWSLVAHVFEVSGPPAPEEAP